jgi:DNA-binding winged helix-turn-helix (wHTH) protein
MNRCVSRDDIFRNIWGYSINCRTQSDESPLNTNTHISVIRSKIAQVDKRASKYIITEKCFGYNRLGEDFSLAKSSNVHSEQFLSTCICNETKIIWGIVV